MGAKGNRVTPGRKGLTALFLLVHDLGLSAADILPEAIRRVRKKDPRDIHPADDVALDEDQYDFITMMGHRIGFLENNNALEGYFHEAYQLMRPNGQMLFTSLDMHTITARSQKSQTEEVEMQFQGGNLIGPFFGLFHLDAKTLQTQIATTSWQCTVLHQQDEDNYIAWLRHEDRAA